ncbi:MAG TPA: MFS transporter [Solirubrobacteraceae bacterium]|nr:MFS transporter [Solirubrobacteraceae bacterium]
MRIDPYRRVLSVPGARSLYALSLLARIPVTAASTALTLRVVLGLHRDFADAGLVATSAAVGVAVGAPLLGRLVDHRGARAALALTTLSEALFWTAAAWLRFSWLAPAAFVGGALALPAFSLARQAIVALLPVDYRQAGLSLDSMSVEVSYAIGPALGVLAVTQLGSATAMLAIAASLVVAGTGLMVLNPATASTSPPREQTRPSPHPQPGRWWLTPVALTALAATCAATITLAGTEIALTASMRAFRHVGLLGAVIAVWCFASLVGGFVYGTMTRRREPLVLLGLLAALTMLLALAGTWWGLLLLVIPSGLFCAPLLSCTAEVIARVAPPSVRGRALGLHTSALMFGAAVGAPLAGAVIDRWSPAAGFLGVGIVGSLLALLALVVVQLWGRAAPDAPALPTQARVEP